MITALAVALVGGGFAAFQSTRGTPDPVASPTPSPTEASEFGGLFIPPDPEGLPPPAPRVPDTDEAADATRFLTIPKLAWTLTPTDLDLPGGPVDTLEPVVQSADHSRNSSGVIALLARQGKAMTLLGLDAVDGTLLWTSRDARDATRCMDLAGGRQLGCVSTSTSAGHVTVFDTATGAVIGTTRARGSCLPRFVGGDSDDLMIAGISVFHEPCFLRGPVGAKPVASLSTGVSIPGGTTFDDDHQATFTIYEEALVLQDGRMNAVVDPSLTTVLGGKNVDYTSWWPGIGVVTWFSAPGHDDESWDEYAGKWTSTETFTRNGLPWLVLAERPFPKQTLGVIGIGPGVYDASGKPLWKVKPAAKNVTRQLMITGEAALIFEQKWSDRDDAPVPPTKVTARDLITGSQLWQSEPRAAVGPPQMEGSALIWIDTDSARVEDSNAGHTIISLDARDGSKAWSLETPLGSPIDVVVPSAFTVGDTLVYSAGRVVAGYRS